MQSVELVTSWEKFAELHLELLGREVSDGATSKLQNYYNKLLLANQQFNLTRLIELEDFLSFHIADTLLLLKVMQELKLPASGIDYLDIGSGCGMPGIAMTLLGLEGSVNKTMLCECVGKKGRFLTEMLADMNLFGMASVFVGKCQQIDRKFSLITARAAGKPLLTLDLVTPLLKPGGIFLAQASCNQFRDVKYNQKMLSYGLKSGLELSFVLAGKPRWIGVISRD